MGCSDAPDLTQLDGQAPQFYQELGGAVAERSVRWHPVEPLSPARIRSWIGRAEPELFSQLVALSGGEDLAAAVIWSACARSGRLCAPARRSVGVHGWGRPDVS